MKVQATRTLIFLIVSIGALALTLRLLAVNYGLPHIYNTDEGFEVLRALKLGAGTFDFGRVAKGGLFYILFIEYGFTYALLRGLESISSAEDFLYLYFSSPSVFWLPGRITCAAFGALACGLLVALGKRAFESTFVGVAAALLLAFHWDHIASTHFIRVDAPAVTAAIASFLVMLWHRDPRANGHRQYLILALLLAFSTMCRIQLGLLILPALLFHANNVRSRQGANVRLLRYVMDPRLATLLFAGAAVYLAGNPGVALYFTDLVRWILASFTPSEIAESVGIDRVRGPEFPQLYDRSDSRLLFYWRTLFPTPYLGLAFLFLSGLVFALMRPRFRDLCLLSFVLVFILMLTGYQGEEHIYGRYLRPIVPIVWLYAAYGAVRYVQLIRTRSHFLAATASAAVMALSLPAFMDGVRYLININKPDTKTAAYNWILKNVAVGSTIYLEGTGTWASPITVPLQMAPARLENLARAAKPTADFSEARDVFFRQRTRYLESVPTFDLVPLYNVDLLQDALNEGRGEYVVIREAFLPPFRLAINQERFPAVYRLVRWLRDDFTLVQTFTPGDTMQGPTLLIYKRSRYRNGGLLSRFSARASGRLHVYQTA